MHPTTQCEKALLPAFACRVRHSVFAPRLVVFPGCSLHRIQMSSNPAQRYLWKRGALPQRCGALHGDRVLCVEKRSRMSCLAVLQLRKAQLRMQRRNDYGQPPSGHFGTTQIQGGTQIKTRCCGALPGSKNFCKAPGDVPFLPSAFRPESAWGCPWLS
jgi:hypothetical protein